MVPPRTDNPTLAVVSRIADWAFRTEFRVAAGFARTNLSQSRPDCRPEGSNMGIQEPRSTPDKGRWISLSMSSATVPSIGHPPRQGTLARQREVRMPASPHPQSDPCIAANFRLLGTGAQVAWEFPHAKTRIAPALPLFRTRQR